MKERKEKRRTREEGSKEEVKKWREERKEEGKK